MPSPSTVPQMPIVLCGCCRSPSRHKQEKVNDMSNTWVTAVFDPTQHSTRAESLPVIVVSCPSTPSLGHHETEAQESLSLDAEDLYFTARTSPEDDNNLKEMDDLVREIRIEAGLPVTPRENELNTEPFVTERVDQQASSSKSTDERCVRSCLSSVASIGREQNEQQQLEAVRYQLNTVAELDDHSIFGWDLRGALSAIPQSVIYVISIIYMWCATTILHIIELLF